MRVIDLSPGFKVWAPQTTLLWMREGGGGGVGWIGYRWGRLSLWSCIFQLYDLSMCCASCACNPDSGSQRARGSVTKRFSRFFPRDACGAD